MTAPGYPFSARDILGDLRFRLAAERRVHPFAPGRRSRGTVLATPHFYAGSFCQGASAVVLMFCKKHRGRGESSLSCGRYADGRSYEAIPQTKIGQGEEPAR
jgi:hypothetical protein